MCDPSQGYLEAAGAYILAAALSGECAAPAEDVLSQPRQHGVCAGNLSALDLAATPPSGLHSTCPAGYQCVPTNSSDPACRAGECTACSFGQYCPPHTSNRCGVLTHNICPAGRSCPFPGVLEECAQGYYCAAGTYDGGVRCPDVAFGLANLHDTSTHGFSVYCANGSVAPSICSAGYICHNSSYRQLCPAGYKCPEGANEMQRCLADAFGGRTPESRCPEGSSFEGSKYDLVASPIVVLALCMLVTRAVQLAAKQRKLRQAVSPQKLQDSPLERFANGQNLLAAVVSGAVAQRKKRFVANGLGPEVSAGSHVGSKDTGCAGHVPSAGSGLDVEKGPEKKNLKLFVSRALSRQTAQRGRGENFISLRLHDVSFSIGKSMILAGLNADMEQGELCALMGESGSGKTTLLNVMSGRATYGTLSGAVSLNNQPMLHGPRIGFVPQAYLVQKPLTVYENLWYSSVLRLPGISKEERRVMIESVLRLLGLATCAHFSCDRENSTQKLSGGQLRRVGIGSELVTRPSILLLDEPTSALDAVNTRLVIEVLKNLCKTHGILVIASLHQPRFSVVDALDKVMVLRRGEFIYAGAQKEALGYFAPLGFAPQTGENPADFFIEVAFGMVESTADPPVGIDELAALWNQRIGADRAAELAARRAGKCTQEEFVAWCKVRMHTVSSGTRLKLWTLMSDIASLVLTDITWELVYASIGSWQMSAVPLPGPGTQFRYCLARYVLSLWRKRSKYVTTLVIMCVPPPAMPRPPSLAAARSQRLGLWAVWRSPKREWARHA
jgi:ABC-type multidrug transport system ATPase subunit